MTTKIYKYKVKIIFTKGLLFTTEKTYIDFVETNLTKFELSKQILKEFEISRGIDFPMHCKIKDIEIVEIE